MGIFLFNNIYVGLIKYVDKILECSSKKYLNPEEKMEERIKALEFQVNESQKLINRLILESINMKLSIRNSLPNFIINLYNVKTKDELIKFIEQWSEEVTNGFDENEPLFNELVDSWMPIEKQSVNK